MAARRTRSNPFRHYATREFGHCQWCNCQLDITTSTVDHVVPLGKGGKDRWKNYALACSPCNGKKGTQDWGLPKFGPFPWKIPKRSKRLRGRTRTKRTTLIYPVNLWPATLTYSLNIPE